MKHTILCRFDPAARLLVRGPDAAAYLQGQFTNELRGLQPGSAVYGLWLNQKGRVLADSFVLMRAADDFEVVSLTSDATTIRERLEAYIIADDVVVEDATAGGAAWIITGECGSDALSRTGFPAPAVGEFATIEGAVVFRGRAAGGPNWLMLCGPGHVEAWRARIDTLVINGDARTATRDELAYGRIEAGVPEIPTELGPGDLPNEGGLEHEAISYTKGCYLGQEVMARLRNMGQVRRRLFVIRDRSDSMKALENNTALFLGERRVGETRRWLAGPNGRIGLAMLHTSHVQPGAVLAPGVGEIPVLEVLRVAEGRAW